MRFHKSKGFWWVVVVSPPLKSRLETLSQKDNAWALSPVYCKCDMWQVLFDKLVTIFPMRQCDFLVSHIETALETAQRAQSDSWIQCAWKHRAQHKNVEVSRPYTEPESHTKLIKHVTSWWFQSLWKIWKVSWVDYSQWKNKKWSKLPTR